MSNRTLSTETPAPRLPSELVSSCHAYDFEFWSALQSKHHEPKLDVGEISVWGSLVASEGPARVPLQNLG